MRRSFVLYDDRASCGNTEGAMVLCCAESLKEARKDARMFGYPLAIYSYDVIDGEGQNETLVEVWDEKGAG